MQSAKLGEGASEVMRIVLCLLSCVVCISFPAMAKDPVVPDASDEFWILAQAESLLAQGNLDAGQLAKVEDLYKDLEVRIGRDDPRLRLVMVRLLAKKGEYTESMAVLQSLVSENPNDCRYLMARSRLIMDFSHPRDSVGVGAPAARNRAMILNDAKDAVKLCPEDIEVQKNLGNAHYFLGQIEEAREIFKILAKLRPSDFELNMGAARLCLRGQDLDDAEIFAKQAAELRPNDERMHLILSDIYAERGDLSNAERERAIFREMFKQKRATMSEKRSKLMEVLGLESIINAARKSDDSGDEAGRVGYLKQAQDLVHKYFEDDVYGEAAKELWSQLDASILAGRK